jgi:Protein of unknown function (DUF1257)
MDYVKRALGEMGLNFKENVKITDYYKQNRFAVLAVVSKEGKLLPLGWVQNEKTKELELQADWFKVPMSERDFTNKVSQLHSKYQVLDICDENRWNVDMEDITVNSQGEIEILATQYV